MNTQKIKIVLSLITFIFFNANILAQTPTISNVMFSQRTDGSHIADIYYDVNNSGGGAMTVTMEASDDDGVTWNFPCVQITGDVGSGVTSGTGKHIVWNFAAEHPNKFEDQMRIKITAASAGGGVPCPGIPTVTYAGKTYNTVQIGNQCWLKENLDVGTMINSTSSGFQQTNNGIIEKYCYGNNLANCEIYGGLYEWPEAMQYSTTPGTQGLCPPGWHIPTLAEFETLKSTVNNDGNALKREDQGTGGGQGTNTSGFSALLAGHRYYHGIFTSLGYGTYFWSSTEYGSAYAYYLDLTNYNSNITLNYTNKEDGFSVRCLKD